ncbi:hypothetical protein GGI24_003698 [Coemansia furcata]|nr:hypothetical protein GGI24_003698 [Coemansia furcata]
MCKGHCSHTPASGETQRIIVMMKEGLDAEKKDAFMKKFKEDGGKIVDTYEILEGFVAEVPADTFELMEASVAEYSVISSIEKDGVVTIQK